MLNLIYLAAVGKLSHFIIPLLFRFFKLLSFVQQVTIKNVGPVEKQYPPGVNLTAVGVDVFVVGAALRCYKDISISYAGHVRIHLIISSFINNNLFVIM